MNINLDNLKPAPWRVSPTEPATILDGNGWPIACFFNGQNPADVCLARNAFDVMLRRGWTAHPRNGRWVVVFPEGTVGNCFVAQDLVPPMPDLSQPDPFTALVITDAWYAANVEKSI